MGYYFGQFVHQAGELEHVWLCVQAGMACARLCWLYSVALHVLGMAFLCTELECSLAFVIAKSENTEKYYLSPSKETNEEKDS